MRNRRKTAGKRGFSSVVGAVFMVLIMSVLASSYFVYTFSENNLYNNTVAQKNQLDQSVKSENLQCGNTTYTSYPYPSTNVNVKANITNIGSTSVQFITFWICASNYTSGGTAWTGYNFTSLNASIQPGQTYLLNNSQGINLTVSGFISNYTYSYTYASWLVTSRGNKVALQTLTSSSTLFLNAEVSQGIGYLAMDFAQFRYFKYKTVDTLDNFPTGSPGYNPPNDAIVFRLNLTNYDPSGLKRTLTINKYSLLWLYFPTKGVVANWYVVNVDATGKILPSYADISVPYGADNSVNVYFASGACGSFGGNPDQVKPGSSGPAAINLLLLGLIGGDQYGQNIPFVSVLIQ